MAIKEFLVATSISAHALGIYYYYQSSKTDDNNDIENTNTFLLTGMVLGLCSLG